jgi:hypothetical protein
VISTTNFVGMHFKSILAADRSRLVGKPSIIGKVNGCRYPSPIDRSSESSFHLHLGGKLG